MEVLLISYGVMVSLGGVLGYVKSKSRQSLLAGSVSGLFLVAAGLLVVMGINAGTYLGFAITVLLVGLFSVRFGKTKKFVPAGILLVISIVVAGALASRLF